MRTRVLIAGAGIAGLALANALQQRGIPAQIAERGNGFPDGGLSVNLPANGVRALGALGFADAVDKLGEPIHRREYRTGRDRLLFAVDEESFWSDGAGSRCVRRLDLLTMLAAELPQDSIRFNSPVRDVTPDRDQVIVDGQSWDFLVGADGIRSQVRVTLFDGPATRSALLSAASWRFMAPDPGIGCWTVWSSAEGTFLLIPAGDGQVYGYASASRGGAAGGDPRWITTTFAGFPAPVRAVLADIARGRAPLHHSPVEEVRIPRWSDGRVTLIGDAAHATAPVWAQGAALAMEDALTLADALATVTDWSVAGTIFEQRRQARVRHVQAMTDKLSRAARLPGWLRDAVLPLTGPKIYRATYEPLRTPVTS